MKYWNNITQTTNEKALILLRFLVGYVFIMEGIQKFVYANELGVGRFLKIGIPYADFFAPFVGISEILFGLFVLVGLLTRLSTIPLIIIMVVALLSTKLPVLIDQGILHFSHKSRNDLSMLFCSLYLLIKGGGLYSLDHKIFKGQNE